MNTERHIFGLRAVERMTGLSSETILDWEARYGIAQPVPGASGERLYSREDIEELLRFHQSGVADGSGPMIIAPTTIPAPTVSRSDRAGTAERSFGSADEAARHRVLVAERDPYAAELTEYFLREEGYLVTTAFTIQSVERRLQQDAPDLVIIEPLIAGGAGFQLVSRLGDLRCPIVILSAVNAHGHPALDSAAAVLTKPVDGRELLGAVRGLLGTAELVHGTH